MQQKCANPQKIPLYRNEILGVIQYYIAGELDDQGIEKYWRDINDLWANFEPLPGAHEDCAAVMQFDERCEEAANSCETIYEFWLLMHIGKTVFRVMATYCSLLATVIS
jgi:hypothetical protein